jgi:ferric-dicitrate binding protein FerR (iron transport regulator)
MMSNDSGMHLDPGAQAALDALLALPEPSDREWAALHGAIVEAGGERLARRRVRAAHLRPTPVRVHRRRRWLAPALSLAAAAVLLLMIGRVQRETVAFDATARALLADVSDHEFSRLAAGHTDAASLLLLAVQEQPASRP